MAGSHRKTEFLQLDLLNTTGAIGTHSELNIGWCIAKYRRFESSLNSQSVQHFGSDQAIHGLMPDPIAGFIVGFEEWGPSENGSPERAPKRISSPT